VFDRGCGDYAVCVRGVERMQQAEKATVELPKHVDTSNFGW